MTAKQTERKSNFLRGSCLVFAELFKWCLVAFMFNYGFNFFLPGMCNNLSSCYRTVPSAIWEILSGFLIFCNSFRGPLGERNNSKIRETRKIFSNIALTTLSLNAC